MVRSYWRHIYCATLAALLCLPAESAAEAASEVSVLSLEVVLELAAAEPPRVLAAERALAAARAELAVARARWAPVLSLSGRADASSSERPYLVAGPGARASIVETRFSGALDVQLTLVDFGVRAAQTRAAQNLGRRSEAALARARLESMSRAFSLYVEALWGERRVRDGETNVERRTRMVGVIDELVKAGLRPAIDRERAEIDRVAAVFDMAVRQAELALSQRALSAAVGRSPKGRIAALPLAPDFLERDELTPETAVDRALDSHPSVAEAQASVGEADARASQARSARWPVLGVQGSALLDYGKVLRATDQDGDDVPVSQGAIYQGAALLQLRWAALDLTAFRRAAQAVREAEAQQAERDAVRFERAQRAAETAQNVVRARAVLERSRRIHAAAQRALDGQAERYARGFASLPELIDAQDNEQRARAATIDAERDLLLAKGLLWSETGTLASGG